MTTIAAARLALSELERAARTAWLTWATYRGYHVCSGCDTPKHCGATSARGPWLCLECWDLGAAS